MLLKAVGVPHGMRRALAGHACAIVGTVGVTLSGAVHAQVAVSEAGAPTYGHVIAVPPGAAGMSPQLSLFYAGGGVNGPVGHGWSIQGLSSITRCPASVAVDTTKAGVRYAVDDKLCLDGQRLIQTDASGNPLAFPQSNDSAGLASGAYREFRTEKDSYARIRAYGYANNDATGASGPAYFNVWTKSGQIHQYGATPATDANTKALISPYGKTVAIAWAVAAVSVPRTASAGTRPMQPAGASAALPAGASAEVARCRRCSAR